MFFEAKPPPVNADKSEVDTYIFRTQTARALKELSQTLKNRNRPVKKVLTKARGGCV
jgi:hypothetical protein